MKWKDFKQQVETQGISDKDEITHIEVDCWGEAEGEVHKNQGNETFYIEDEIR